MSVFSIGPIFLSIISVFSLIILVGEEHFILPLSYNEFGIPSSESPPTVYLIDRNMKQLYADGSIFVANELYSNVTLVIPSDEYLLVMPINNSNHNTVFTMYYIMKVSEYESGYTYEIKWKPITLDPKIPSQEFEIPLQFEEGVYRIEVFLWHDLTNPKIVIPETDVINDVVKAITIDTKDTRYVSESNITILNSTQQFVYKDNGRDDVIISQIIIDPQGYSGGNYGGLEFRDQLKLVVSSDKAVYGDIVYFDIDKQKWVIVKQALSKHFDMDVEIPEEQSISHFKWGFFVLNPNAGPVTANMTTIITKYL